MNTAETGHAPDSSSHCPRCDTELNMAVLGGQCPVCVARVMRDSAQDDRKGSPGTTSKPLSAASSGGPAGAGLRYFRDYELLGEIGRGGMGIVHRACQLNLNRTVALKLIASQHVASPRAIERFHTEAEAAASLDHPSIVPIYETGEWEGRHFFSMKLIEGRSLALRMSDFRLTVAGSKAGVGSRVGLNSQTVGRTSQIARLMAKVAEAVHFAHQRGILHRDLKPGNILIDANGEPHVTDFGLARRVEADSSLTLSGEVLGTPAYMAPEQAAGKTRQMTTASDVYSLGIILYELLAGRPPFWSESAMKTLNALLHDDPPAPRTLNPAVPRDLETICLKCLERDPARRYPDANELAEELRRFDRGEPIRARAVTAPEKVWRWCRRKPALAGMLFMLFLVFMSGIAGVFYEWRTARQNELVARENLYVADIGLIQKALDEDNFREAVALLQKQVPKPGEPDFRGFEWRYLWQQCQSDELFSFPGHHGVASCVSFSPDGRRIATGGSDNTTRIWDLASHREVAALNTGEEVCSACFSSDGDFVVVSTLGSVRLFNARTYATVGTLTGSMRRAVFSADGKYLVTAKSNGLILWDTRVWTRLKEYDLPGSHSWDTRHALTVAFAVIPNTHLLAVALSDHIAFLDLPTLENVGELKVRMPTYRFVASSPNGKILATPANGHEVILWDVAKRKQIRTLNGHSDSVFAAAFSPDGRRLATGSTDQTLKVWDVATGQLLRTFRGHMDEIWDVAFSPDGQSLASVSKDGAVKIWNASEYSNGQIDLQGINSVGFGEDGSEVAVSRDDQIIRIDFEAWGSRNSQSTWLRKNVLNFDDGTAQVFPNGIAAGFDAPKGEQSIEVWDLVARKFLCALPAYRNSFSPFSYTSTKRLMATVTGVSEVTIWKLPEGERMYVLTNSSSPLAFASRGATLATSSDLENQLTLWKIASDGVHRSGTSIQLQDGDDTRCLAFSPDGSILATAGFEGLLRLWSVPSGRLIGVCTGHKRGMNDISFSPDGNTVASIADDATLRLWNVATKGELLSFRLNLEDTLRASLGFSPDGNALLARKWNEREGASQLIVAPSFAEIALAEGMDYRAVAKTPYDWNAVGKALAKRNRLDEAVDAFTRVIALLSRDHVLLSLVKSAQSHRAAVLRRLGRLAEAGDDNCKALDIPRRSPQTPADCVDLSAWYNGPLESQPLERSIPVEPFLDTLPHGLKALPEPIAVLFDIRGVIHLKNGTNAPGNVNVPASVTGIPIHRKCGRLHFLQATAGQERSGFQIATYVLHYADHTSVEVPVRFDLDTGDWSTRFDTNQVCYAKVACAAPDPRGGNCRLFEQSWDNPHPEIEIESLDFVSKLTKCAPFVVAITAEP